MQRPLRRAPSRGAARPQPQPHCLLLVFVQVELPEDSTEAERADFEAGHGGALVPVMCVDLAPERVADFAQLRAEADGRGAAWAMVLAGALGGQGGHRPDAGIQRWVGLHDFSFETQAIDQIIHLGLAQTVP